VKLRLQPVRYHRSSEYLIKTDSSHIVTEL